jgi:spore coat protein H
MVYTQVEQPNKKYLRIRHLYPNGQLYKANFFEFYRYPEVIRLETDPLYSKDKFSAILENKGNSDNSKLIRMLDDLNNYSIPIEQTFEKYFDQENYFTWMAYNILIGNLDTQSRNFLLYSPQNANKWYFMPWDYDGTLFRESRLKFGYYPYDPFEYGISNYWGSLLANRVLRVGKYRQKLNEKVKELKNFLTPERINSMVDSYRKISEQYMYKKPDFYYDTTPRKFRNLDYEFMSGDIQINYDLYLESLQTSMPFFLGVPQPDGDQLVFSWDESFNYSGGDVSYHFMLGTDSELKNILFEDTLKNTMLIKIPMPEPGAYYWRVLATNENNKTAYAFDQTWLPGGEPLSGMKYFTLNADGQVLEP